MLEIWLRLPFENMPCVAYIQKEITVALHDSRFVGALAKCHKIVGHFKHSPANTIELKLQQTSHGQEEELLVQDLPTCWNSIHPSDKAHPAQRRPTDGNPSTAEA